MHGKVFFRCMELQDKFPFRRITAEFVCRPLRQPFSQRRAIDIEHEDLIEQVEEPLKIPRAAAEESDCVASISDKLPNFFNIPDMMPMTECDVLLTAPKNCRIKRVASFGITRISEFPVAVDHMMATLLQFRCNRSLTGPGNTLNQIVSGTHRATARHS